MTVEAAEAAGALPVELRHRIVRGTVAMMISVTSQQPHGRYPLPCELEEMAKLLTIKFPSLLDPVTKHVCFFLVNFINAHKSVLIPFFNQYQWIIV